MTLYTVHLPVGAEGDDRLLRAVLVKDGVHWLALVLPLVWLLMKRIWWGALAYVAISILLMALTRYAGLPEGASALIAALLGLFVGSISGDLLAWQLGRRGYRAVDVVSGRDEEEAARRFFDRSTGGTAPNAAASRPVSERATARAPVGLAPAPTAVIGLFPDSGGRA